MRWAPLLLLIACNEARSNPGDASAATSTRATTTASDAGPRGVAPELPRSGPRTEPATATKLKAARTGDGDGSAAACRAPSLSARRSIDGRDSDALERCVKLDTGLSKIAAKSCGIGERRAKDLERFVAAVPPIDDATRAHVREVFARGKSMGRDPKVFGLVGDSITVSGDFLTPFAKASTRNVVMSEWVKKVLTMPDGDRTIVDYFRGATAESVGGAPRDSFDCFRAAKVGARATYGCESASSDQSPVAELVRRVNPAFAVVTFGANDAAYRVAPPEEVAADFEKHLLVVVEALESRGVVAIVSNEMRHGDQPGVRSCPEEAPMNDWRVAVGQNANAARAAEVSCRAHLPFIDLRHALDAATNFGLYKDNVHLSTFQHGAGVLTEEGLDCGNNIRNLVTLLALKRVVEATVGP